jgi:alpha-L-fucosidase 2
LKERVDEMKRELEFYDVVWHTPSHDSRGSMPLGNGDIGLNVWVEPSGDLLFYISKTDAWSEDLAGERGLVKLGRVRVHLSPSLPTSGTPFLQTLKLREGEISIIAGVADSEVELRVWVDANQPVIRVEASGRNAFDMKVSLESWRTGPEPPLSTDMILPGQTDRIVWYYRNSNAEHDLLRGRTFGAVVTGSGLVSESPAVLVNQTRQSIYVVSIYPKTAQTDTAEDWIEQVERSMFAVDSLDVETARARHREWWSQFWDRSWIFASGDEDATLITRAYVLQRFVSACAGRGEFPIKFNGSIFNVDAKRTYAENGIRKEEEVNADFRAWGGRYWFQNTRHIYWPMLMAGDFEMMEPFFRLYAERLDHVKEAIRSYYGHDGAYFPETINPLSPAPARISSDTKGSYVAHYYAAILELSAMMLDYYAFTGDDQFLCDTLLPTADAGLRFYDEHFSRGTDAKILLSPVNSLETYWKTTNPTPDIAGLNFVLTSLLSLAGDTACDEQVSRWRRMLSELPQIPLTQKNGKTVIAPAAEHDGQRRNFESTELYAIFPYRMYGVGKPDLEIARNSFQTRDDNIVGCWHPSPIQGALVGETDEVRRMLVTSVTLKNSRNMADNDFRFPAFWGPGHDWTPDEDHGGVIQSAFQRMLMHYDGDRILLFPTWPKEWDVDFKLHGPMGSVVEGRYRSGQLESLSVTPEARREDVMIVAPSER